MFKPTRFRLSSLLLVAALSPMALAQQAKGPGILDYLKNDGRFQIFLHLLQQHGLDETLKTTNGGSGFTVLAPTDDAFGKVSTPVFDALSRRPDSLVELLEYHVLFQRASASQLILHPKTWEGEPLSLTSGVPQRTARLLTSDVATRTGTVQVIDQVLYPSAVQTMLQHEGAMDIAVGLKAGSKSGTVAIGGTSPKSNTVRATNRRAPTSRVRRNQGRWYYIPSTRTRVKI